MQTGAATEFMPGWPGSGPSGGGDGGPRPRWMPLRPWPAHPGRWAIPRVHGLLPLHRSREIRRGSHRWQSRWCFRLRRRWPWSPPHYLRLPHHRTRPRRLPSWPRCRHHPLRPKPWWWSWATRPPVPELVGDGRRAGDRAPAPIGRAVALVDGHGECRRAPHDVDCTRVEPPPPFPDPLHWVTVALVVLPTGAHTTVGACTSGTRTDALIDRHPGGRVTGGDGVDDRHAADHVAAPTVDNAVALVDRGH